MKENSWVYLQTEVILLTLCQPAETDELRGDVNHVNIRSRKNKRSKAVHLKLGLELRLSH